MFMCARSTCPHNVKAKYRAEGRGVFFLDRRLGRVPCIELLGGLFVIVVFSYGGSRARKSKGERPLVATLPPRHTSPGYGDFRAGSFNDGKSSSVNNIPPIRENGQKFESADSKNAAIISEMSKRHRRALNPLLLSTFSGML